MPINYEGNTLFSTEELSHILSVDDFDRKLSVTKDQIETFISEKGFRKKELDGASYLEKDDYKIFFDQFARSLGVSYKYHEVPSYMENCTSPWAVTLVKMYRENFNWPAVVSPAQGALLRSLVCNINPNNVLEIGCFTGVSSIWMASALEELKGDAVIHSIDVFDEVMPAAHVAYRYMPDRLEYARRAATSAQLSERIRFYKNNSVEMAKSIAEVISEPVDLIFIDGDHSIRGCLSDFMLYYPHVSIGGYIVLHDIYPEHCGCDGPRFVIDNFIKNSRSFELIEMKTTVDQYGHGNYGMALIRKLGPRQDWTKQQKLMLRYNYRMFARKLKVKFREGIK